MRPGSVLDLPDRNIVAVSVRGLPCRRLAGAEPYDAQCSAAAGVGPLRTVRDSDHGRSDARDPVRRDGGGGSTAEGPVPNSPTKDGPAGGSLWPWAPDAVDVTVYQSQSEASRRTAT